jgi:hypothetical protein
MTTATVQALDLTKTYPRSPNALLGDYILLARITDKCRAVIAGTNGAYNFNCPMDRLFFDFTGIDADAFKAHVASGASDDEVLAWVVQHSQPRTRDEILTWAYKSRWMEVPESYMAFFEDYCRKYAPNHPYLKNFFQMLDAEEGRL